MTVARLREIQEAIKAEEHQHTAGRIVLYLLVQAFQGFGADAVNSKLEWIVESACELAILYGRQRCRVQIFFHPITHKWKKERNDVEVMAGDDDALEANVDFVITPGLRKYGNGHGARLDESAILCKSWIAIRELDMVE